MKNTHFIITLSLLLFGLSCTKESAQREQSNQASELSVMIPLPSRSGGVNSGIEDSVKNIDIFVVDNATGDFLYHRKGGAATVTNGVVSFTAQLLYTDKKIEAHLFINLPADVNIFFNPDDTNINREYLLQNLKSSTPITATTTNPSGLTALPMYGMFTLDVVNANTNAQSQSTALLRSVAKVTTKMHPDATTYKTKNFLLEEMTLYYFTNEGQIAYDLSKVTITKDQNGNITNMVANSPSVPDVKSITPANADFSGAQSAVYRVSATNNVLPPIYTYEHNNFKNGSDIVDHPVRVVVKGRFEGETQIHYYPIDFKTSGGYLNLLRNTSYDIAISAINGDGSSSEEEAAKATTSDIVADIIAWNNSDLNIIFDGAHWLSVESKNMLIGGEFGTIKSLSVGSSIASANWSFAWSNTQTPPADNLYQNANTLADAIGDAGVVSVTKPTPAIDGNIVKQGTLTINALKSTTSVKYLFIKVNSRLVLPVRINIFPDGYKLEDWNDGGDKEVTFG